ncbi:MAG: secretin and TonB N-terminal domain-containing protein [Armatimonadetes bacterium]|nr:secretin and TonB N-terminal domain-containing protein [Armatimonadota bacterium]
MKKDIGRLWKVGTLATLLTASMPLLAQNTDVSNTNIPALDFDQADIRDAVRALFKNAGDLSFTIAPDVQGQITMSIKNKPFATVLESILSQADATYRIEGSTYVIIHRPQQTQIVGESNSGGVPTNSKVYASIKIQHADPLYIFTILSGSPGRALPITQIQLKPEPMISGGGIAGGGGFSGTGSSRGNSGSNNSGPP